MFFGKRRSKKATAATGEFIAQTLTAAQNNGENVAEVARSIAQSQIDIETGRVQFIPPSGNPPRVHRSSRRRVGTRHTGNATVYSSSCATPARKFIAPR